MFLPPPSPIQQAASIIALVSNLNAAGDSAADSVTCMPTRAQHHSIPLPGTLNISPASMKINPALFTPAKQARAVTLHLHLAHVLISLHIDNPPRLSPIPVPDPHNTHSQPSTPLLLNAEDPAVLRLENEALRAQLKAAQATVADQDSAIRGQNAQLLIQDLRYTGLQKRLNVKVKHAKQSNVVCYLQNGRERVYTAEKFQEAV